MNPENTFYSVKRFIGRRMDEVDEESKVSSAGRKERFKAVCISQALCRRALVPNDPAKLLQLSDAVSRRLLAARRRSRTPWRRTATATSRSSCRP